MIGQCNHEPGLVQLLKIACRTYKRGISKKRSMPYGIATAAVAACCSPELAPLAAARRLWTHYRRRTWHARQIRRTMSRDQPQAGRLLTALEESMMILSHVGSTSQPGWPATSARLLRRLQRASSAARCSMTIRLDRRCRSASRNGLAAADVVGTYVDDAAVAPQSVGAERLHASESRSRHMGELGSSRKHSTLSPRPRRYAHI